MTSMPPVALLAGGMATRLRPLTEKIPKALIEVGGAPFIVHQLELLRSQGVTRVVLCLGYKAEMIEAVVGDGRDHGLEILYSLDGPTQLGTGGALRKAAPLLGPDAMVMYGDSWLDTAYRPIVEAYRCAGKPALMTVFRNEGLWDRSNVWFEDGTLVRYDKASPLPQMHHIDWGLSLLRLDTLNGWPADAAFDLADVFMQLSASGELAGYEVSDRFYEIGSHSGLQETDLLLRAKAPRQ